MRFKLQFPLMSLLALLAACAGNSGPIGNPVPAVVSQTNQALAERLAAHRQGHISQDINPLHWAIDGPGYFSVLDPKSGETLYTRNGAFLLNEKAELITAQSMPLTPAITLRSDLTALSVDAAGTVWARSDKSALPFQLGTVTLTSFAHPEKLEALGDRDGVFRATAAAGKPEPQTIPAPGQGLLLSGATEDFINAPGPVPDSNCLSAHPQSASNWDLDLAIDGKGYFVVVDPWNGDTYFTRAGRFLLSEGDQTLSRAGKGTLVNVAGMPLTQIAAVTGTAGSPLVVSADAGQLQIGSDGEIRAFKGQASTVLGYLGVVTFDDPTMLEPVGFSRQSLYRIKFGARAKVRELSSLYHIATPGRDGTGKLRSRSFEACGQDLFSSLQNLPRIAAPSPSASASP